MKTIHDLHGALAVEIVPARIRSPEVAAAIDAHWQAAQQKRPGLFDGAILSVVTLSPQRLVVAPARYRDLVAARMAPHVRAELGLRPLAVSGLLSCPDGLVFGRRAADVTQAPGLWELVPSGGVDAPVEWAPPDLTRQILTELREEIGLRPDQVRVGAPLGLIDDQDSGVVDVVMPLWTDLRGDEIQQAYKAHASAEYDAVLATLSPEDIAPEQMLDETRLILKYFLARRDDHAGLPPSPR